MRFLRDLSVGRKLATSAGVALLLLGVMVALVTYEGGKVADGQVAERQAKAARAAAADTARLVVEANNAQRGVLLANDLDHIAREAASTNQHLDAPSNPSIWHSARPRCRPPARRLRRHGRPCWPFAKA